MKTLVVVGDIHANSSVAVCPPGLVLDDGNQYERNKTQMWLWSCWMDFIEKIDKNKKGELIVVVDGEAADYPHKHDSNQYVTNDILYAREIGISVIEPLANLATKIYFTRGTEAHVGNGSTLDESIAKDFTNTVYNPDTNTASWYWLPLQIEGIKCDIAHHTRMGNIGWTQRGYAVAQASRTLFECAEHNRPIPNLVFRQHVHRWSDSYDAYDNIRCIIGGCWTSATSFINRITPGALAEIGGSMTFIDGDQYEVTKLKYEPEKPKWSKVK